MHIFYYPLNNSLKTVKTLRGGDICFFKKNQGNKEGTSCRKSIQETPQIAQTRQNQLSHLAFNGYLWTKSVFCVGKPDVSISHLIFTSFLPVTARFIFQNSFAY